jgi:hypothetical protein
MSWMMGNAAGYKQKFRQDGPVQQAWVARSE